jgi:outer membrane protein TolC
MKVLIIAAALGISASTGKPAETTAKLAVTNAPAAASSLPSSLSLVDAINIAIERNPTIKAAAWQLESAEGIALQSRAIALPKIRSGADYQLSDPGSIEQFPFPGAPRQNDQRWTGSIRVVQSIYEGGRIASGVRSARLTRERAVADYQATLSQVLLNLKLSYNRVLLAEEQVRVQEASVELLTRQLQDLQRRFESGMAPRFNLLRAEVELANARPKLIRARNAYRLAKIELFNLVGQDLPPATWDQIPLRLTDTYDLRREKIDISESIQEALRRRPELHSSRLNERLGKESVVQARAGYLPSLQGFAGYGGRSSQFSPDLSDNVNGWFLGAQLTWDIFDGQLTRGRVREAEGRSGAARAQTEERTRQVELEVRTAYSQLAEAEEVLDSQQKAVSTAEEALRLATVRLETGTGTQLDQLSAQTALTEVRSVEAQAKHDYSTARARMQQVIGRDLEFLLQ